MTEIPEHLLKRAQAARDKSAAEPAAETPAAEPAGATSAAAAPSVDSVLTTPLNGKDACALPVMGKPVKVSLVPPSPKLDW